MAKLERGQDVQRDPFTRAFLGRSDASGAAAFARTSLDQEPRFIEQLGCAFEQALGETHAAGVCIEQKYRRVEAARAPRMKVSAGRGQLPFGAGQP